MTYRRPIQVLDGYPLSDDGWWVQLTRTRRVIAWAVAKERDRKALAANANPDKHAVVGSGEHEMLPMTSTERNYVGCLGELALAVAMDLEWSGGWLDWAHDDDVCGLEVRATTAANGALRVFPRDKDRDFVLAVVYHDGLVRLAGWRSAQSLRESGRSWDGGVRWAPQRELWPMESLERPDGPRFEEEVVPATNASRVPK